MRIEDLRVFSVVSDAGSLHRAAEKLGITQSAVTKIVQRLEAEFDVRLIDRVGRGIELTSAGRILLRRAQDVRESVGQTYAEMAAARSAVAGTIRMGVAPSLLESGVLNLIARNTLREKELRFALTAQVSVLLLEILKAGDLDLALCFMPDVIPDELQVEDLGRQKYHIVGRLGHPLAGAEGHKEQLRTAQWLLPVKGHGMRNLVERYFEEHGLGEPRVAVETDASTAFLTGLLRNSDLLTILTDRMFNDHTGRDLVTLPYDGTMGSRVGLFHRRKSYLSPAVNRFRAALREELMSAG